MITVLWRSAPLHAQYIWSQRSDFPDDPRSACCAMSFPDFGTIGMGYDGADFHRSMFAYDPLGDIWTQVTSMGGATGNGLERDVAASFVIGTKGYVGTGQGGAAFLNDFWEYDAATDTWTPKSNVGGSTRRSAVGFSIGDYGYIALGQDASGFKNDLWQYDPVSDAWTQMADYAGTARRLAVAFVIDDIAYVGTGDDGTLRKDFYSYNAVSNTWTAEANFGGTPRSGATAFALNGKGYVLLGYDTTLTNRKDFWMYDPFSNFWTQLENFPGEARSNAVSFVVDSAAFIGTGYDTACLNDLWRYGDSIVNNPDTGTAILSFVPALSLQIFPQPVVQDATLQIDAGIFSGEPVLTLFDMQGRNVTDKINLQQNQHNGSHFSYHISCVGLSPGLYELLVETPRGRAVTSLLCAGAR